MFIYQGLYMLKQSAKVEPWEVLMVSLIYCANILYLCITKSFHKMNARIEDTECIYKACMCTKSGKISCRKSSTEGRQYVPCFSSKPRKCLQTHSRKIKEVLFMWLLLKFLLFWYGCFKTTYWWIIYSMYFNSAKHMWLACSWYNQAPHSFPTGLHGNHFLWHAAYKYEGNNGTVVIILYVRYINLCPW